MRVSRWIFPLFCLLIFAAACTGTDSASGEGMEFIRTGKHQVPLPKEAEPDPGQTRGEQHSFTLNAPLKTVRDHYLLRLIDEGWLVHSDVTPQHYRIKKGTANLHLFITQTGEGATRITIRPAKEDLLEWLRMMEGSHG